MYGMDWPAVIRSHLNIEIIDVNRYCRCLFIYSGSNSIRKVEKDETPLTCHDWMKVASRYSICGIVADFIGFNR